MATSLATLKIKVDHDRRTLRNFQRDVAASQKKTASFKRSLGSLKGAFKPMAVAAGVAAAAITAFAAAGVVAVKKLGELAQRGQKVKNVQDAFNRAIGGGARSMRLLKDATSGLVDEYTLMAQANTAITLGSAETVEQFAELARTAQQLGRALGLDAAFALESLNIGIARQSKLILDNLGIMVSIEQANQNYADSIGRTVKELTDAQKKEAFRTEAMRQARVALTRLGETSATAGDMFQRFATGLKDIKDAIAILATESVTLKTFFGELASFAENMVKILKADAGTIKIAFEELGLVAGNAFSVAMLGSIEATFRGIESLLTPQTLLGKFFAGGPGPLVAGAVELVARSTDQALEQLQAAIRRLNNLAQNAPERATTAFREFKETLLNSKQAVLDLLGPLRTELSVGVQRLALDFDAATDAVRSHIDIQRLLKLSADEVSASLRRQSEEAARLERGLLDLASTAGRLAGGGGFGGFLKSLVKIGSFFIPGAGPFISAGLGSAGFDHGGTIGAGKVGIVGERGPELVSGPAHVTSRADTAAMMGGDVVVNIVIEQEGVPVRRITRRQQRDASLGLTHRLALPAPAVG